MKSFSQFAPADGGKRFFAPAAFAQNDEKSSPNVILSEAKDLSPFTLDTQITVGVIRTGSKAFNKLHTQVARLREAR